ncbi:hypothetical protein [Anaeromyxobacter oryzisoli]|uniref:hypothetical protein n=1 Tax=Anaeromyxobacter oryzisoli TaxID=2925408 RepID=UPI001F587856|nr:hypothetical protein [Anaeromyxobacter sp. SG63]
MPKPPRAACALLASGLLAACSPGPDSSTPPAPAAGPAAPQPGPPTPAAAPASPPAQPRTEPQEPVPGPSAPQADAASAPAVATPPSHALPLSLVVREVAAIGPGGAALSLARAGETVVDPAARFRVVLAVASRDVRVVLVDGDDALVAASSSREVGAAATRIIVTPSVPLDAGSRYTFRIEGAVTRELHDVSGKAYAPTTLALRAAGQPAAAEHKEHKHKQHKAKAKRRHR